MGNIIIGHAELGDLIQRLEWRSLASHKMKELVKIIKKSNK